MNASTGANPEAVTITEVTCGNTKKAAQAGPVSIGDGEARGEGDLAGLVEGLGAWSEGRHIFERSVAGLNLVISSEAELPVSGRFRELEKPAFRARGFNQSFPKARL
ncbi:MAG: hypothetical protein WBX38_03690 [Candidatus Sulfotelmatobacter sp.]